MADRILTHQHLESFRAYLIREEKSSATIEKYLRDARGFLAYAAGRKVSKEQTLLYKRNYRKKDTQSVP